MRRGEPELQLHAELDPHVLGVAADVPPEDLEQLGEHGHIVGLDEVEEVERGVCFRPGDFVPGEVLESGLVEEGQTREVM